MPLRLKSPLPELTGATEWLNGEPDVQAARGQPLLVFFWSQSCHICHENMPAVKEWRDTYTPKGLKMIAIHAPREEGDLDVSKVRQQVSEFCIGEPCGVDNDHILMERFENTFLPAYFLYDRDGTLLRRAAGNAGVTMIGPLLEKLYSEEN